MRSNRTCRAALCGLLLLIGCGGEPEDPKPNPKPDPSPTYCESLTTERECFESKCAFFATVATLQDQGQGMCSLQLPRGICLHAEQIEGPAQLTRYTRQREAQVETVQLQVDVPLPGWTRCGNADVPPDCDCDGK